MTEHRIKLCWERPPLHANTRRGWRAHAAVVAQVRADGGWLIKAANVGTHDHVTIGLEWRPAVRRVRDGGENLAPLLKILIDAAVDVRVVPGDTPDHVTRTMPALLPVDEGEPGLWLLVETP